METAEAVAVRGIDISTYLVKDAARAKAFYRDVMGFRVDARLRR
jgi:catechol 2,3-dioxygenase-like lactoylglutathione lyase family enzyme